MRTLVTALVSVISLAMLSAAPLFAEDKPGHERVRSKAVEKLPDKESKKIKSPRKPEPRAEQKESDFKSNTEDINIGVGE